MSRAIAISTLAASLAVAAAFPAAAQQTGTQGSAASQPTCTCDCGQQGSTVVMRGTTMVAPAPSYVVTVGGRTVTLAHPPIAVGASTLVPLRDAVVAMGGSNYRYNARLRRAAFDLAGRHIVVNARTRQAMVNRTAMPLSGPVRFLNGQMYVRAQFVSSLNPSFQVARQRVAGFRGAPSTPPTPISSFSLNGQTYSYAAPTFYTGPTLMVPLDETLNTLGAPPTNWQPGDLSLAFTYNGQNVLLNLGSGYAHVGSQAIVLDKPVMVRDGRVYVPASFIMQLEPGYSIPGM